jgi:oxygen-dependent protoporphyrinogen oxidase
VTHAKKKVVVIGGGIAGLTTAFYLQRDLQSQCDITLIEGSSCLGGKITSLHEKGFVIEGGPDSFLAQKESALDLCRTLGLGDQIIGSRSARHPTYVWSRGRLHPMPEGMMLMAPTMILPFLRSPLISWPGKMRMGMELFIPPAARGNDESLASFVRRRLGSELLDKIAAPLMAGIYAADPKTLSLRSTFPMFMEMEHKYGGLLRGMFRQKRQRKSLQTRQAQPSSRRSMFMTLRGGLQQLVDALLEQLDPACLQLDRRVLSVERAAHQYSITLSDGSTMCADDIVFATPAYATADMVQGIDPILASKLRAIRYVSTRWMGLDLSSPSAKTETSLPAPGPRRSSTIALPATMCSFVSSSVVHVLKASRNRMRMHS